MSRRTGARQTDLGESPRHAAQATRWLFHLLRLSPRIRRVYVYQWFGGADYDAAATPGTERILFSNAGASSISSVDRTVISPSVSTIIRRIS